MMQRKTIQKINDIWGGVCEEWDYRLLFFDSFVDIFDFIYKTDPSLYVTCFCFHHDLEIVWSYFTARNIEIPAYMREENRLYSACALAGVSYRDFADYLYLTYGESLDWLVKLGFSLTEIYGKTPDDWQENVAKDGFTHSAKFMGVD